MNKKEVWEYGIYYKNGDEFFTENEYEVDNLRQDEEDDIENIYLKKWVYNEYTGDYEEEECFVIK